jgi:hypothetical protein
MKQFIKKEIEKMIREEAHAKKALGITNVNSGELGLDNWSAEYNVNKKLGKDPYIRNGFAVVRHLQKRGKTLPNDVIYLTIEEATRINAIGQGINHLIEKYGELCDELGVKFGNAKGKNKRSGDDIHIPAGILNHT